MSQSRMRAIGAVIVVCVIAVFSVKEQLSTGGRGIYLWVPIAFASLVFSFILLRLLASWAARKVESPSNPETSQQKVRIEL